MSTSPDNQEQRFLLLHCPSEALFEAFDKEEYENYLVQGDIVDVTGNKKCEEKFRELRSRIIH